MNEQSYGIVGKKGNNKKGHFSLLCGKMGQRHVEKMRAFLLCNVIRHCE